MMNEGLTYDDLYRKVLALFPDATLGEDNDGQLVVYTDLRMNAVDVVEKFEVSEPDDTEPVCRCDRIDGLPHAGWCPIIVGHHPA